MSDKDLAPAMTRWYDTLAEIGPVNIRQIAVFKTPDYVSVIAYTNYNRKVHVLEGTDRVEDFEMLRDAAQAAVRFCIACRRVIDIEPTEFLVHVDLDD